MKKDFNYYVSKRFDRELEYIELASFYYDKLEPTYKGHRIPWNTTCHANACMRRWMEVKHATP